jgi:hypothetical protein
MKYLLAIWAEELPSAQDLAILQAELPGWDQEMDKRGGRQFGRELDLPDTAVTVQVRGGETLVTDGPFAETKEFMAGFMIFDCDHLDEVIEAAATCPISRFQALEIRPFMDGLRLDEKAYAFGRGEDSGATPYLLTMWMGGTPAQADYDGAAVMAEGEAWRQGLEDRGVQILGNALQSTEAATTVRVRGGQTLLTDGPFTETKEFIGGIDVVGCTSKQQAIEVAAAHPLARYFTIEVRPFYCE